MIKQSRGFAFFFCKELVFKRFEGWQNQKNYRDDHDWT
jgi:hypothetical protein